MKTDRKVVARIRRHRRVRRNLSGTAERPRLAVFRSNQHIYAQIIDDQSGKTLTASNTLMKDISKEHQKGGSMDAAAAVGQDIARKALLMKVETVVFDRGGFAFAGRVRKLAEAAREYGLKF
jgi:large subunit ribosomal protein L18